MAIINSYASGTVTTSDLILGVDTSTSKNTTKTFSAGDIASLASGSTAYDSYVALLTQTGTAAPVATEVYNNTGETFTWSYISNTLYRLTSTGTPFTVNKTVVFLNGGNGPAFFEPRWNRISDNVIEITTSGGGFTNKGSFEVKIYN